MSPTSSLALEIYTTLKDGAQASLDIHFNTRKDPAPLLIASATLHSQLWGTPLDLVDLHVEIATASSISRSDCPILLNLHLPSNICNVDSALKSLGPHGAEHAKSGDILRFIFSASVGDFVLERKDFISERLGNSENVIWAANESDYTPINMPFHVGRGTLLGSILFRPAHGTENPTIELDELFRAQNCDPSLVELKKWFKRTIAWVSVGPSIELRQPLFSSIAALGIRLITIDKPGHWSCEKSKMITAGFTESELPFAFIPFDTDDVENLATNLVASVRAFEASSSIHVDGIITFQDHLTVSVCQAALDLGFTPERTPQSYENCLDKHVFRQMVPWGGHSAYLISSKEDIDEAARRGIYFPAVFKPKSGGGSQGVLKVINLEELYTTWDVLLSKSHGSVAIIEPFVSGQEVDINIVLDNGKLLFYEVWDNDPTSGDLDVADDDFVRSRSFVELCLPAPSALPLNMCEKLRDSALQAIQTVGFKNYSGVFHVEARISDSEDTLEDIFIIEINPRMPGITCPKLTELVWGVDYVASAFLAALGRSLEQLTRPFRRPQVFGELVCFPAENGGTLKSDPLQAVRSRDDVFWPISWPTGLPLPDPSQNASTACFALICVVSRESRSDCRKRSREVQNRVVADFVE